MTLRVWPAYWPAPPVALAVVVVLPEPDEHAPSERAPTAMVAARMRLRYFMGFLPPCSGRGAVWNTWLVCRSASIRLRRKRCSGGCDISEPGWKALPRKRPCHETGRRGDEGDGRRWPRAFDEADENVDRDRARECGVE